MDGTGRIYAHFVERSNSFLTDPIHRSAVVAGNNVVVSSPDGVNWTTHALVIAGRY